MNQLGSAGWDIWEETEDSSKKNVRAFISRKDPFRGPQTRSTFLEHVVGCVENQQEVHLENPVSLSKLFLFLIIFDPS